MQSNIFATPLLTIESLKTKFDTNVISNSFIALIGDYVQARFLQQLHYWSYSEYGVVIDGIRWIYKPLREWLSEVFTSFTEWQLRKAIASLLRKGLIKREKLFVKHHDQVHNSPWWHPKNQTYYYSINYDKLQELIEAAEKAESTENVRIESFTKLSVEDFSDTKFCDCSQNNTDITSNKNYSKDKSHPTLPSEWESPNSINQDKGSLNTSELTNDTESIKEKNVSQKAVEVEANSPDVELKVNQDKDTNRDGVNKPRLKITKRNQSKRESKAPWKDEGQFKQFYRELIKALPIVANAPSPHGLAQTIIRQLRCGIPHTYWDDFEAGQPIGWTDKPEWEIEPGVPYPMFVEYLTEKLKEGKNTTSNEQTRNEVFRILSQPRQAKAFWVQFKRSVVNVSEQVQRDLNLGVTNPNTPVWTRERIEPSIEEAATAGEKIMAVNNTAQVAIESAGNTQLESEAPSQKSISPQLTPDPWTDDEPPQPSMRELLAKRLGNRNLKGFVKEIPKVSQEEAEAETSAEIEELLRQKINQKFHINQMSIAEINRLLADPIMRKELTPQIIFNSKFDVTTDNLGEILAVKISQEYLNNGGK